MNNFLDITFWQWLLYDENRPLLFTQGIFWCFFAFLWVIPWNYKNSPARILWLLFVSLYFYYLSSGFYFILLIFSTIVDFVIGKAIFRAPSQAQKKFFLFLSLFINLGLLAYFKYTYFFADLWNELLETNWKPYDILAYGISALFDLEINYEKIFLPAGISFYTFQTLSYSIDIYRGKLTPVNSIVDFAFFVSFFPQLIAGPIVRAADFIPQIRMPHSLSEEDFGKSIYLILTGLFKKIVISDYLSINWVDRVFAEPVRYSAIENLLAVYGYAIQIYCDFSGYSDIAIGIALLLGFRLNINFNSPYQATNITDFWRRWHISLSSWLRDYLYISLGGNRKGKLRTYVNLLITMLLGGLWHGAHIRFIIWGALHGIALACHKIWLETFPPSEKESFLTKVVSTFFTFHFVCFCWIFFRAENLQKAFEMITQMTTSFEGDFVRLLQSSWQVFAILLLGFVLHFIPFHWKEHAQKSVALLPDFAKACLIVLASILFFQFKTSEIQPFIYFQF
ncbi:MAG: MBOAT family protein [Cytophagales bacterium]|nr:MBOAT family protein [Cytophagales bacterium]MDW8384745.1 MBOAT family O-acyltransferase [Flammeovirgaceae bacterium]